MKWPSDFVWRENPGEPSNWKKPGLVMFFNLECPGCVSRGIPFMKKLYQDYRDKLVMTLIHTSFGHKHYTRDEVLPTLTHFADSFAKLPFPVALDLEAELAEHYRIAGTPHWLVFQDEAIIRSLFGSQDNTQQRLEYLFEELFDI